MKQAKRKENPVFWLVVTMAVLMLVASFPVRAQDTQYNNAPSQDESSSRPQYAPVYSSTVTNAQTGEELSSSPSILHWGHLSLMSFNFVQSYQMGSNFTTTNNSSVQNSTGSRDFSTSAFGGFFSYDVRKSRFNFNLQYRPSVWISAGDAHSDFTNQRVNLSTSQKVGRWVFRITDDFYALPLRAQTNLFGYGGGSVYMNGNNQNPYQIQGGHTLNNFVRFSTDRLLGPRDRISVGGGYQYLTINDIPIDPNDSTAGFTDSRQDAMSGNLSWDHTLGWRSSIVVGYSYTYNKYREQSGQNYHTGQHHGVMATYNFQPLAHWKVSVGGGPAFLLRSKQSGFSDPTAISYQALASVTREFRTSTVKFQYGRDDAFNGIFGDAQNDHVELSYSKKLFRNWQVTGGGGYTRQVNGLKNSHAFRGWGSVAYSIARNWSMYGSFSTLDQSGVQPLRSSAAPKFISFGISWSWTPTEEKN